MLSHTPQKTGEFREDFVNFIESKSTTETTKGRSAELEAVSATSHDRQAKTQTVVEVVTHPKPRASF